MDAGRWSAEKDTIPELRGLCQFLSAAERAIYTSLENLPQFWLWLKWAKWSGGINKMNPVISATFILASALALSGPAARAEIVPIKNLPMEDLISIQSLKYMDIGQETTARMFEIYDYASVDKCRSEACPLKRIIIVVFSRDEYPEHQSYISEAAFGWTGLSIQRMPGDESVALFSGCVSRRLHQPCTKITYKFRLGRGL